MCVVLFNTCHLFPQTAIDLCGFLVVDRRRTSVFGCVPLPAYVESVFGWICLGLWILFLTVEIKICRGMFSKPERGAQWIIILGAQVRGRKITDSLKRRLDAAIHYLEENERTMVVVSGGRGREKIFQKRMQWNNILSNKELRKIGSERKISPFLQEKI